MATEIDYTEPRPLFHHVASERVLHVAHGLVFSIALKEVVRHELIAQRPVLTETTHPFGRVTGVSSLLEVPVRRGLADAEVFGEPGALESALDLWRDFCDALAEHLGSGEALEAALLTTWVDVPPNPEGAT